MKFLYHPGSSVPYGIANRPAPISYVDENSQDRWCLITVNQGKHKGKQVCLVVTFKNNSIVDLGDNGNGDEGLDIIPNQYLDFNLEGHLETNRILEEYKVIEQKKQIALAKLTEEDKEILGLK